MSPTYAIKHRGFCARRAICDNPLYPQVKGPFCYNDSFYYSYMYFTMYLYSTVSSFLSPFLFSFYGQVILYKINLSHCVLYSV